MAMAKAVYLMLLAKIGEKYFKKLFFIEKYSAKLERDDELIKKCLNTIWKEN